MIATILFSALVAAAQPSDFDALVAQHVPATLSLYREIHENPELAYQEARTAEKGAAALEAAGFKVRRGFGRYEDSKRSAHGVVGVLENGPGPVLLLRADMDALPVEEKTGLPYASKARSEIAGESVPVMHACGHDLHTAAAIGAAKVLSAAQSAWRGKLVVVLQPAEEAGDGAKSLLDGGLYESVGRPDYLFAFHASPQLPVGAVGFHAGYALAETTSVDISVRGKGGHGAFPHETVDPIVMASKLVLALQDITSREIDAVDAAVISVGKIRGGEKRSLIPDAVELELTVRTFKPAVRTKVLAAIERHAKGIAAAAGAPEPVVRILADGTPAVLNDPVLSRRLAGVFSKVFGEARVVETPPVMGGEDFGRLGLDGKLPSTMFWLGATSSERLKAAKAGGEPVGPLHSSKFRPDAEGALAVAMRAFAAAAVELLPAKP